MTQSIGLGVSRRDRDDPEEHLPVVHDRSWPDRRGVLDAAAGRGRHLAPANLIRQPLLGGTLALERGQLGELARPGRLDITRERLDRPGLE
jgi:hypothetical protein